VFVLSIEAFQPSKLLPSLIKVNPSSTSAAKLLAGTMAAQTQIMRKKSRFMDPDTKPANNPRKKKLGIIKVQASGIHQEPKLQSEKRCHGITSIGRLEDETRTCLHLPASKRQLSNCAHDSELGIA
jgi:hypothetical protein